MSFITPSLPENAPFSPLQRVWLDAFLAGLLGDGGTDAATANPAPGQHSVVSHAPEAPTEPEDFPWHDPGLPLDERIALAAGQRHERVLMAAMAQTDCGQCGYSCRAYAEDLLDLLEGFPSARPPLSELISALSPLKPRLYSIASSPLYGAGRIDLTVAAVRYEKRVRRRTGVASTFLCDRVAPGTPVSVYIHPPPACASPRRTARSS